MSLYHFVHFNATHFCELFVSCGEHILSLFVSFILSVNSTINGIMARTACSSPHRQQDNCQAGAISLESPASCTRSARNTNPSPLSHLASANPHTDLTYSDSDEDYLGDSNDDDASSSPTNDTVHCSGDLYHELLDAALLEDNVPPESFTDKSRKGKASGRRAHKGRPPPPATKGMSEEEAKEAIDKWRKDWKSQRDKNRRNNRKCASVEGRSYVEGTVVYTGCTLDQLQTMESVLQAPLLQGHTFLDKGTLH